MRTTEPRPVGVRTIVEVANPVHNPRHEVCGGVTNRSHHREPDLLFQCCNLVGPGSQSSLANEGAEICSKEAPVASEGFVGALSVEHDYYAALARCLEHAPLCEHRGRSERLVLMPDESREVVEKLSRIWGDVKRFGARVGGCSGGVVALVELKIRGARGEGLERIIRTRPVEELTGEAND